MDNFKALAAAIIDTVEDTIRKAHPQVEKIASEYTVEEEKPNTLLYGETYYDLESDIAEDLRKMASARAILKRFFQRKKN